MVVRGAPAIGVAAGYGVALEALHLARRIKDPKKFIRELQKGIRILAKSRPTAVNLFWGLDRMERVCKRSARLGLLALARHLLAEARNIHREDVAINRAMGRHGAKLLKNGMRVLTHCNAGALATAGHGTALGVIRSAVSQGKKISVVADETRPFLQGARLTCWEMVQERIPVTLISDNMAGHLMAQGEIDAVIVGTDRVAANGDVANKIGTYMVAVLARGLLAFIWAIRQMNYSLAIMGATPAVPSRTRPARTPAQKPASAARPARHVANFSSAQRRLSVSASTAGRSAALAAMKAV
jgi:methylthioribose-1-phosphate isomerase